MAHKHSVYDTGTHFIIDPITRAIQITDDKPTLVQFDHNSERFTFEIPRFVDGHDMSLCNEVQVHYLNIVANKATKHEDVYEVDDLQISPASEDVVICSWLITQNATGLAGFLNFLVRFSCVTDGVVDYAWHTAPYAGITVSDGMNHAEMVVEQYADVLEQWRASIPKLVAAAAEEALRKAKDSGEFDGATFTPSLSPDGDLSWSNNGGLENPPAVNIKGPAGKSAYAYAKEAGYAGDEATFTKALNSLAQELRLIVSDTDPGVGPVLWFDTGGSIPVTEETVILLELGGEEDETSVTAITAIIGGEEYPVKNLSEPEATQTGDTYQITVQ